MEFLGIRAKEEKTFLDINDLQFLYRFGIFPNIKPIENAWTYAKEAPEIY